MAFLAFFVCYSFCTFRFSPYKGDLNWSAYTHWSTYTITRISPDVPVTISGLQPDIEYEVIARVYSQAGSMQTTVGTIKTLALP